MVRSRGCNVGSSCLCEEEKMDGRREARHKLASSLRDMPEILHALTQLWNVCFHRCESNASQFLVHTWFMHNKALHTGWYSESLLAVVTTDLSVGGWVQNGFSAFHSIIASTLISASHNLRYVTTLWQISIWSDTSWLEQNNLQSKIVKLKLWPLACLRIGKYIGNLKHLQTEGSWSFPSMLFKAVFCYCMLICVVL